MQGQAGWTYSTAKDFHSLSLPRHGFQSAGKLFYRIDLINGSFIIRILIKLRLLLVQEMEQSI